jgi:release factor glutamine methyltransferase
MTNVIFSIQRRRIFRLPTVYRPQDDSYFLIRALEEHPIAPGARVLDMCTGSGVLALAAAQFEPQSVLAVDVSWPAVMTARINASLQNAPIEVMRGQLSDALARGPFDVVLSNPPYVPCEDGTTELRSRCWDAGPTGRLVLDPLCQAAPELLAPGGFMLIVQSEFSGEQATLDLLQRSGLVSEVVARTRIPFGPVCAARFANGSVPGQKRNTEELVVIRADKPS